MGNRAECETQQESGIGWGLARDWQLWSGKSEIGKKRKSNYTTKTKTEYRDPQLVVQCFSNCPLDRHFAGGARRGHVFSM